MVLNGMMVIFLVKSFDWVIHCGAISDTTERDVEKVLRQNYEFTLKLLNVVIKIKLIFNCQVLLQSMVQINHLMKKILFILKLLMLGVNI